jgi:hypothetical protein
MRKLVVRREVICELHSKQLGCLAGGDALVPDTGKVDCGAVAVALCTCTALPTAGS